MDDYMVQENPSNLSWVIFRDPNCVNKSDSEIQTYMNGKILYYELESYATVTYNLPRQIGYAVQPGGTEQLLPTTTSGSAPTTSPIRLTVNYPLDAVGTIVNLPKNYISTETFDVFTNNLQSAINTAIASLNKAITIKKTTDSGAWDSTNNRYNITVTVGDTATT